VKEGHVGNADLKVTTDSSTWLGFVAKERNLVWALLRRKIRIKGSPRLLLAFGKCFRLETGIRPRRQSGENGAATVSLLGNTGKRWR